MAWKKIVQRLNIRSVCPSCRFERFDYQPGANPHDQLKALVECPECGWKGELGERDLEPIPPNEIRTLPDSN
jgi:hypothetical protein